MVKITIITPNGFTATSKSMPIPMGKKLIESLKCEPSDNIYVLSYV